STSGGMSSLTLPSWSGAPPVTSLMAAASASGVAWAPASGSTVTTREGAKGAARKARRFMSVLQCREIRPHLLDLGRAQDRLAAKILGDPHEPGQPVVGRHDRVGIETRGVDHAQPELAFAPARASARQARRQVALEALLRDGRAVAEEAKARAAV